MSRARLRGLSGFLYARSTTGALGSRRTGGRPMIRVADKEHFRLSFWNVAELHVLDSMRRYRQISPQKLRGLIDYLEDTLDTPHPLVKPKNGDRWRLRLRRARILLDQCDQGGPARDAAVARGTPPPSIRTSTAWPCAYTRSCSGSRNRAIRISTRRVLSPSIRASGLAGP